MPSQSWKSAVFLAAGRNHTMVNLNKLTNAARDKMLDWCDAILRAVNSMRETLALRASMTFRVSIHVPVVMHLAEERLEKWKNWCKK